MSTNNNGGSSVGNGSSSAREISSRYTTLIFEECHTRIQTVAELLFISCTPRPVFTTTADLAMTHNNFEGYRDRVIGQLNKMLLLSRDVATQAHSKHIYWKQLSQRVRELTSVVVSLLELSAHISYLMAVRCGEGEEGAKLAIQGPVESVHCLTQADLDIRFSCQRLKRSRVNDLQPQLLVELSTALTKSLSVMTEVCRHAAEKVSDSYDQDQFKLCVKTITSTISCLVTSIKSFKKSPSEHLLRRVMTFCDPVISSSAALLTFATEDCFIGSPASLTDQALEMYKASLGLSVSISSAIIQMFRAVRDLIHSSSSSKRHQDRLSLCVESLTRSSSQLRDVLLSHSFVPSPQQSQNSFHHSDLSRKSLSLWMSDKDGSTSLASTSCSSWEKFDDKKQNTMLEISSHEKDHRASIDRKYQKQGRTSMSPHGSPTLSPRDSRKLSHSKMSSKSAKLDKDNGSRSPRTKDKRHKSSSSTSSSSSSHYHHHHHSQHTEKEKITDRKHISEKADIQLVGEQNMDEGEVISPMHTRGSENIDNFFFSQTESEPSFLSTSSSSLQDQRPGLRPMSIDVEVVLASLAPDSPSAGCLSTEDIGEETLAGIRELHIAGAGLGEIPGNNQEHTSRL